MPADRHPAHPDEESRYLALLNALSEIDHEMVERDVPITVRQRLAEVIELCRADFSCRFGR